MAQPQKRRPESARRANRIIQTRTLLLLGVFGVLTFVLLFTKLYHWQITEHDELQSVAVRQQTLRTTVEASRGTIYDRNGTILAMSASAEDIFLSPKEIIENDQDQNLIANGLAEILNLDAADILKKMEKTNSQYEILKKKADDELADKVREFINKNELRGVFLRPTSKRSYPKGTLASQVIGFANDNGGSMGLEATYNDELTGENGMVVTARDRDGRSVLYQYDQYFDAENGCDLHTTLDTTIQYYLEKGVQELEARFGTGKGATGIVMDVNTGAVLAMASLPTYDLNAPGKVYNDFLTSGMTEEQIEENMKDLLNKQWRSKAINDTYEPGSTFKTLTLAMALEENVVDLNTGFYCGGNTTIEGQKIWCSKRVGHGQQNLTQAFANSCNPAFINIGLRVGNAKFYQYMQDFGLLEKTGIDTTGEASGFANSEIKYSTLALACYAFGQNFNVTPLALIAAQAACVNGGYLHTPYLVEQIVDSDGNITYQHDNTPVRQVVSEETSAHVRECLEYVVSDGTGRNGQVKGYRVGGKTGTADKGQTGDLVVSFVSFAPADDPQVIILVTMDTPSRSAGTSVSGGSMVAPVNSKIMADILPYLGIEPTYSAEELLGADTTVPYVIGSSVADAKSRMESRGFTCKVVGAGDTITDQTPAGGAVIPGKSTVILYAGAEKPNTMYTVPQLVGKTAAEANVAATNAGLLVRFSGATQTTSGNIRVLSQSLEAGQQVPAGTVITVQLGDANMTD